MPGALNPTDVFILAAARTPIGGYNGSLASLSAVDLGKIAVQGVLKKCPAVAPTDVDIFYFGNVVSAGNGQNVARQVAVHSGLPATGCPATTVNKVCASGMKAMALAAQAIRLGEAHVAVAGGTESMSTAPHLFPKARFGCKYGNTELLDSLAVDGLTDAFGKYSMGIAAEATVKDFALTREMQDNHAIESYTRAQQAHAAGVYQNEIVPVEIPGRGGVKVITTDDEAANLNADKLRALKPSFDPKGSVTAGNASPLSDGAAAMVLVSGAKLAELAAQGKLAGVSHVYKLRGYGEAEQEPIKFTTTPSAAIPVALQRAGLTLQDVEYTELNEAFSCVALANTKILGLDPARVNVYGGAVGMGHPLGCSGARIVATLCTVLATKGARIGVAGICNGGGGASACVIERVTLN